MEDDEKEGNGGCVFTTFYKHPQYGEGVLKKAVTEPISGVRLMAKEIGESHAADLVDSWADCEDGVPDDLDNTIIMDDLELVVFYGDFKVRPDGQEPDFELT